MPNWAIIIITTIVITINTSITTVIVMITIVVLTHIMTMYIRGVFWLQNKRNEVLKKSTSRNGTHILPKRLGSLC